MGLLEWQVLETCPFSFQPNTVNFRLGNRCIALFSNVFRRSLHSVAGPGTGSSQKFGESEVGAAYGLNDSIIRSFSITILIVFANNHLSLPPAL